MARAFNLDEAAAQLRVSKRWLQYWLASHPVDETGTPFYVPMGRSKTFEEADIARIRAFIREEEKRRLSAAGVKRAVPFFNLPVGGYEKLVKMRANQQKPKAPPRRRVRLPRVKPKGEG
jgi:hypothetical protein